MGLAVDYTWITVVLPRGSPAHPSSSHDPREPFGNSFPTFGHPQIQYQPPSNEFCSSSGQPYKEAPKGPMPGLSPDWSTRVLWKQLHIDDTHTVQECRRPCTADTSPGSATRADIRPSQGLCENAYALSGPHPLGLPSVGNTFPSCPIGQGSPCKLELEKSTFSSFLLTWQKHVLPHPSGLRKCP